MSAQTLPVVFRATGRAPAQQYSVSLEAYEAQSDAPAWWPARLTIAQDAAERSFDGRLHGLSGESYLTFSSLVERRGNRHVYADLLRGRTPSQASNAFAATFVPPHAAAQIRSLIHQASLKGVPLVVSESARAEAQRLRTEYGSEAALTVEIAFDPSAQRSADARRGVSGPGL